MKLYIRMQTTNATNLPDYQVDKKREVYYCNNLENAKEKLMIKMLKEIPVNIKDMINIICSCY